MALRLPAHLLRLVAITVFVALISAFLGASPASAATGSITGKVTRPDGTGSKTAGVSLYAVHSGGMYFEKSVSTRSDGTYTLGSLEPGKYVVGFAEDNATYATEYWNDETTIQNAAPISVGTSKVSNINAKLAVGGKVIGRVLTDSPNSHPVAGVEVAAYRYDVEYEEWTYGKSVLTSSDGRFTLGGLSVGQWTLEFNPPSEGTDADLALEYWEDSRVLDEDETFLVRPGMTVEDKEAHLAPAGRISGKVTGPDGEPVVDAFVFGYPANSKEEVGNVALTDENGNYVMTGLSPGQQRLEFVDGLEFDPFGDGPAYASEWWDDKGLFETADRITVSAGETSTGKDARLEDANAPLANTSPPTIEGETRFGETLTANPGSWTPHVGGEDFAYRWFVDGQFVPQAWNKTFTPTTGQVGKQLTVEVTATSRYSGESATVMSAPSEVLPGVLRNITKPTYEGELRVGSQKVLTRGTWNVPVEGYAELLADGVKVPNTGSELSADLLGKRLSVRMTATKVGYEPVTVVGDETEPVQQGVFKPLDLSIGDPPIVGVKTTVDHVYPPDGSGTRYFSYQWFADGTEIAGANYKDFYPTVAQEGKALTVRVTRSRAGFETLDQVSEPTEPVAAQGVHELTTTEAPQISGPATVGTTLKPQGGQWTPQPDSVSYEWLANGESIGEGHEFTLTAAHVGKRISVRSTAIRRGYVSATADSAETEPVSNSTPFGAPHDFKVTDSTVTSLGLSWTRVDGAAKYRIAYGIGSGTRSTVEVGQVTETTLKGLKPNSKYSIDIAALPASGSRSPYSPRINGQTVALVAPTSLSVSQTTSTSVTVTWKKAPGGVPKYRIAYGIGSGTRSTMQVGDVDTATITGLKPGTTYTIDMASVLNDGTRSSYTSRIPATTAP